MSATFPSSLGIINSASLTKCLRLISRSSAHCRKIKSVDSAAKVCEASRTCWALFLSEWKQNVSEGNNHKLLEVFRDGVEAIQSILDSLSLADQQLVKSFISNIEFRIYLARMLPYGVEIIKEEMRRRVEKLELEYA